MVNHHRSFGRLTPVLALSVLLGSAASGTLSAQIPEQCIQHYEWEPSDQPLSTVMDSAAATERIEALWSDNWGHAHAYVSFDTVAIRDSLYVFMDDGFPDAKHLIHTELRELLVPNGSADNTMRVFIGDERGPGLRSVAEFHTCAPEIVNRSRVLRVLGLLRPQTRVQPIRLALRISREGEVLETRVEESSGDVDFDLRVANIVKAEAEFRPAYREGIPVSVWVAFPVSVSFGAGR